MSTTARHARNDRIVQLRARGLTIREIAEDAGVSERHCARILEERKQTTRSSTSRPTHGTGPSSATVTELLDRLQTTVGDLAAVARGGSLGLGASLRVEITLNMAEQTISELRGRSDQLAPANLISGGEDGSPPFWAGHVMTRCVRVPKLTAPEDRYLCGTAVRPIASGTEMKKAAICGGFLSSGGGIRTRDLRVMSPTSYLTAPPRGVGQV